MSFAVAVIIGLVSLFIALSVRNYLNYIKLRFKLFALRDEILHLGLEGRITEEQAANIYNFLNWPIRHLLAFPVVFCFGNMAQALAGLEDARDEFDDLPVELQNWYAKLGKVVIELIWTFTPLGPLYGKNEINGLFRHLLFLWLMLRMISLIRHPLTHNALSGISVQKAKAERDAILQSRSSARDFAGMALSH